MYKAYVPIECGKCDFTTKRVRLLLRHPCRGNKKPEENELRIVDVTGSGDAKSNLAQPETQVSQPETQMSQKSQPETQESQESQKDTQVSKESQQEAQESQESQGEAKVKAPLSKEEKVARNLKKRQRTKRKVAEIRAEAKALGYRTPALMGLRKKKKRKMNIPFVLNFPAEETKVTTMAKFRYGKARSMF